MSQGQKRVIDQDPDYESIPLHAQQKRIKLHEQDAKEAAVKKIDQIVRSQFSNEISARESELDLINQRIYQVQMMLDRLRVGIITKYYASAGQATPTANSCGAPAASGRGWEDGQQALASVHPTVRQFLGKAPVTTQLRSDACHSGSSQREQKTSVTLIAADSRDVETVTPSRHCTEPEENYKKGAMKESGPVRIGRGLHCKNKVRVIVGNVSKYIPFDKRDGGGGEQATHKWLAYVRTAPSEPWSIADLVQRVRFFLHPSYRPHDLVEVTEAPFQVQRKGWGEFPLRVQLHFHDRWTKHVDIIHHLKLDKTYTGLQTLGSETVVDLWIPSSAARSLENLSSAADDKIETDGNLSTCAESARAVVGSNAVADSETDGNLTTCAESARAVVGSNAVADSEVKATNEIEPTESPAETDKSTQDSLDGQAPQLCSQTCGTTECLAPIVKSPLLDEQPWQEVLQVETNPVAGGSSVPDVEHKGVPCLAQFSPKVERKNCNSARDNISAAKPVVLSPAVSPAAEGPSSLVNIAPKVAIPKKPPTAVNSNGVVSSTFVKCTDTLGRVLLIPATSLLSPPCTPPRQQSSLLRPVLASPEAVNTSVLTVPTPGSLLATSGAPTANVAAGGALAVVGLPNTGTTVGITHQQVAPSSRISGKASTHVPASVPGVTNVVSTNVLPNIAAFTLSTGSLGNPRPVSALSGSAAGTSVKIAPAPLRAIRPAVSPATVVNRAGLPGAPPASSATVAGPSGSQMPNTSSVVCVTPVKTGGVLTASPNGTANLISVVCNKPVRPSVNVPTPIVPVTAAASSALVIAASVPANNTDTVGVSTYKAPSETRTEVSPRVMPPMVSPASHLAAVKPVAPSASTYTLVMLPGSGGSQSQIVVLPTNILRPKDIAPTVSTAQGQQSLPPSASQESQPSQTTRAVPPAATFLVQSEKADPAKELQDKLDTIRLSELKDMREAILAVAAHFPLVGVTEAEIAAHIPLVGVTEAESFLCFADAHGNPQWMRAGDVRQTLQRLIDHERPTWFLSSLGVEDCQRLLPSRRSIVLLCRHFGFTPLHPDTNDELQDTGMGSAHTIIHNSYSEPCELVARLADAVCAVEGAQECTRVAEEEVDVEGVEEADGGLQEGANMPNSRTRASVRASAGAFPGCLSPEKSFPRQAKVHLPLSPMAAFVREAASEVGVHLTSCELEPRVDVPVVEEMIVSACKNFATALLRNAVNMAFRRVDYESTPSSVSLEDTYRGILDLRECSFLTNENLGIEATREGTCDDAHV